MSTPASRQRAATIAVTAPSLWPNRYDLAVFVIIVAIFVVAAAGLAGMSRPLAALESAPLTLDPVQLPAYALFTTLRMLAAIGASLLFTFVVATLAARSRKAEMIIIPALDILQSVPVLGFLTFTVVFFMGLFPGSQIGAECAAVFAIFTSQAWNMAFAFYQSLKTTPRDLDEAARHFRLSGWQRFWKLDVPHAVPSLVWNTMMSMSGGWFFVVASEAISVGDTRIALPGIGSWLSLAIERRDIVAVAWAVGAMALVILIYDQLLFRPIVAWADKFRMEQTASATVPQSWVYDALRRTRALKRLAVPLGLLGETVSRLSTRLRLPVHRQGLAAAAGPALDRSWLALVVAAGLYAAWVIVDYVRLSLGPGDLIEALAVGALTLLRVVVLIALASLIWVPIGVWIGLRPAIADKVQPLAQFLAAFPANVLFPVFVVAIATHGLDPNIWLSPLMILGTQWYILFNVIAGASAFPNDLKEAAALGQVRGWLWWRKVILPGIFPHYVTGALTASGGSWNASIVAEMASWGQTKLEATGLGAYIAKATDAGDFPRVALGIAVMSLFVILFNRLFWRRLYIYAERHLRLS